MELEHFAVAIERGYGIRLEEIWSEQLTLGELLRILGQIRLARMEKMQSARLRVKKVK